MDRLYPELDFILIKLSSTHSPTVTPSQREDNILERIFLPHKQSKKMKDLVRKDF